MRSRAVAVFVALGLYLLVGADLIRVSSGPADELVGRIQFVSSLPSSGRLGPQLAERTASITVVSTLGRAFTKRRCPNVNETICERESGYSEPVAVAARVTSVTYAVDPRLTLRCDTPTLGRLAGTLDGLMRAEACTPELGGQFNVTDASNGNADFTDLAFSGGCAPPLVCLSSARAAADTQASRRVSAVDAPQASRHLRSDRHCGRRCRATAAASWCGCGRRKGRSHACQRRLVHRSRQRGIRRDRAGRRTALIAAARTGGGQQRAAACKSYRHRLQLDGTQHLPRVCARETVPPEIHQLARRHRRHVLCDCACLHQGKQGPIQSRGWTSRMWAASRTTCEGR
jgi:hypothetical protein